MTRALAVVAALALVTALGLFLVLSGAVAPIGGQGDATAEAPSDLALADIPADYLALYQAAGSAYRLDWAVLAGVGKVECDHGRSQLQGCNPPGTINSAGARGPMQFLGSTWRRDPTRPHNGRYELDVAGPPIPAGNESQGYATDADNDATADPWTPDDAIHAAARLLATNGATDPERVRSALLAYNRSSDYADEVLYWADAYRAAAQGLPSPGGNVELVTVRGITVHVSLAADLEALLAAAEADGHTLTGGGYRDPARQVELRRQNCGSSYYAIYLAPSSSCTPPTARPGNSMHERGLAVDFECDGELIRSRSSACFAWMSANAPTHGLYNLPSEPWHWSRTGT